MNKNQQIVEALNEFISMKGLSANSVAQMIGISGATISQMRKGEWNLISQKMWLKVSSFLRIDAWKLVNTLNYSTVRNICIDAQENARFVAISAKSGLGKTAALLDYQKKNPNTFYVLGDILMSGRKQFLAAIQQAMGLAEGSNPTDMLNAIVEHINECVTPLLIIDDGGKLNDSNLRILQLIFDRTEGRLGIVLAGTEYLHWHLQNMMKKKKMGFEELFRRIETWDTLLPPNKEEIASICMQNGIKNTEVLKWITAHARNFGSLKAMITNALHLTSKKQLSLETLAASHKTEVAA